MKKRTRRFAFTLFVISMILIVLGCMTGCGDEDEKETSKSNVKEIEIEEIIVEDIEIEQILTEETI